LLLLLLVIITTCYYYYLLLLLLLLLAKELGIGVEHQRKKKLYADDEEDELELDKYADAEEDVEEAKKILTCMESLRPKLRKLLGLKSEEEQEKPEDYWRNPVYHPWLKYLFPLKVYMWIARGCDSLVMKGESFNLFIICTIIAAGILVGVQTYDGMDSNPTVDTVDFVILGIFCFECIVKVLKEGLAPTLYFRGKEWKWNCFDFSIVFLSFPQISSLLGGGGISLLRLVRLSRLGKLIRKIPQLSMIVTGLIGGLSSIVYIMALLILVFYLYGVVGYYLFYLNDPFHFGSVPMAMITLFRIATLCNWGDIMYVNILGCDRYADMYVGDEERTPHNRHLWCKNPDHNYFLGAVYFITFVILAAFVMLSLFIGAVTTSMNESMEEAIKLQDLKKKEHAKEANLRKIELVKQMNKEEELTKAMANPDSPEAESLKTQLASMSMKDNNNNNENDIDKTNISARLRSFPVIGDSLRAYDMYKRKELKSIQHEAKIFKSKMSYLLKIGMGEIIIDAETMEREQEEREMNELGPRAWLYLKFSRLCRSIVYSSRYQNLVTLAILVASVNVGATTDIRVQNNPVLLENFNQSDTGVLIIFSLEIIFKIIGEGFSPFSFFNDNWNKFDFIIVLGSILPSTGGLLPILRLLRLLRVLKLIKFLPQLVVIINALLMGLSSISYVGLILLLFIYVYAIIGMILFQASDPFHFGTLHMTMICLFRAATLDDWNNWMYTLQFGCARFPSIYDAYPDQCVKQVVVGPIAVLYFLVFIIIGGQVLLNLFIGVIATSMDQAREAQKEESDLDRELKKISKELSLTPERVDAFFQVFRMLDLDDGGKIEEAEIKTGLEAIESTLSEEDILTILDEVDSEREGIDVVGFIRFMSVTPSFKRLKVVSKQMQMWNNNNNKEKKKKNWFERKAEYVYGKLLGAAARQAQAESEAALVIQQLWRSRKAKREAAAEIERRKEWRRKQKMKEMASIEAKHD